MGLQIESGWGKKTSLLIDEEGRAFVLAVNEPQDLHINQVHGKVWSIPFEGLNPAGADDYVLYIKNIGAKNLKISDIRISADTAASQIELHKVTGTVSGGSAITPVARNLNSSHSPDATIESGTDLTGLTSGGVLFFIQCTVVNTEYHLRTTSNIVIPKGGAVAMLVETATANVTGIISLIESE